jgi:hypothetical protein|tara:strand:- start:156 stop:470 length:315 start_codon:yes stop_codon:yes gene_type:complete
LFLQIDAISTPFQIALLYKILTSRGDNCSVGNNNDWLLVLGLEVLLDKRSDLLESSVRSVWDSHKEVLSGRTISLLVLNVVDVVDEDYVKMLLLSFVVSLELAE